MSGRLNLKGNYGLTQIDNTTNIEQLLIDAATGEWVGPIGPGEVTTSDIVDAAVTYAKIQDVTALSVVGRAGNTTGVTAAITAANDGEVLRRSGTSIGFGTIVAGGIASDAITTAKILDANVTYAKIANGTGLSVIGRSANSAGVNADIAAANDGEVLRRSGTTLGFGTIVAGGIASNAVTTAKILDANVTLAKLASGITPSHVVKFANQVTTVGGAAAEAFTVTGAAATDLAYVQVVSDGTANVTVLQAVVTTNTLTVTFSADPGNDCVINYQLLRAAT